MKKDKVVNLNKFGRFSMSDWSNFYKNKTGKISVKSKNNWHNVKQFGLKNILKLIKSSFNSTEISKLSLIDIGCNDGYLTEQLAKINFKEIIGVEPRVEAINRGNHIRKILRINSRVKYYQKTISELRKMKSYDVSVCSGVLHHTDNIFENLKKILFRTKKLMILEGEFLSDNIFDNKKLLNSAQLKDIIYEDFILNKLKLKKFFGISLKKFETSTYDGSTIKTGLVEIPSIHSVEQYCKLLGYDAKVIAEKSFKKPFNVHRAIIAISKSNIDLKNFDYNFQFEKKFINTILPLKILKKLKKVSDINKLNKVDKKKYSIVLNRLKFNFIDKLHLEYSKYYYFNRNNLHAINFLYKIISKKNSDWFSCYRALFLMCRLEKNNKKKWKDKLLTCNPSFPKKLINYL